MDQDEVRVGRPAQRSFRYLEPRKYLLGRKPDEFCGHNPALGLLAQDNSEIAVLTVSPLAVLFRIPAQLASDAQFTPDSREIVFVSSPTRLDRQPPAERQQSLIVRSPPHVESWKRADGTRVESTEIKGLSCATEQLSPDGRTLACDDPLGTLRIVDVPSAETLLEKKKFVKLIPQYDYDPGGTPIPNGHFRGDLGQASLDFSPDGHFLLARPTGGAGNDLAYEVRERSVVGLPVLVRNQFGWSAFLAPHWLLISAPYHVAAVGTEPELAQGVALCRHVSRGQNTCRGH